MPVFRIARASAEVEVSRLEANGHRVKNVVIDGDDLLLFCDPLWRDRDELERRLAAGVGQ